MKRVSLSNLFGAALLVMMAAPAGAKSRINEQEAHAIAVDAMPAGKYLAYAAALLKWTRPTSPTSR